MRKRFNLLPTYHFEENTDGQIRGAAERVLRDCTIYGNCGRNLISYPYLMTTKTENGITFTDNGDGTVTADGTATADATFRMSYFTVKKGVTYYLSGCPKGGSRSTFYFWLRGYDVDIGNGLKIAPTYDFTNNFEIVIKQGAVVDNLVFKPQFELGETATDYEPYKEVGDSDAESGKYVLPVTASGKNLLPYPFRYHNIYGVKNGITVTDSGNSSITLNGTAAANTVVYIETSGRYPLAAGKYFLSGKPSDITGFRLTAGATGNDGSTLLYVTDGGAGAVFDISGIANKDDYQGVTIAIRIDEGTVFDNFVLKPQLELGEAATDFEPYTAPKTTNLLLDAPLGPGESISCREKGLLVPELATTDPRITNYITFGSEVKPSSANFDYYKY